MKSKKKHYLQFDTFVCKKPFKIIEYNIRITARQFFLPALSSVEEELSCLLNHWNYITSVYSNLL